MKFTMGGREVVHIFYAMSDTNEVVSHEFLEVGSGIKATLAPSYMRAQGLTPEKVAHELMRRADQLDVKFPQPQDAPRLIKRGPYAGYFVDDAYGF